MRGPAAGDGRQAAGPSGVCDGRRQDATAGDRRQAAGSRPVARRLKPYAAFGENWAVKCRSTRGAVIMRKPRTWSRAAATASTASAT